MKLLQSFFLLIVICLSIQVSAQQSSKTKAANKLYEKGGEVEIINATPINTSNLEFSPAYYQNGIVYITSRETQGKRDKKIDETYFELFYAEMDGNGLPVHPKEFSLEVNSQLHEGPVTFDRDGKVMYFTRNNTQKGVQKADKDGVTRLKIYEAKKGPVDWKDVTELSFNDDSYSCAHPTLSADGRKLYFTSDMPGGSGGMDLYVTEKTGDGWSKPINLGADVNTEGNEVFPFIHSSGNLIFSSDGYEGMGGLDLYMINISGRKWGEVMNLGEPFNSPSDDLGLILNPDGTKGYFASARSGGAGKDDIYMFVAKDGLWGKTKPNILSATINVFDARSSEPIENAEIRIFEKTTDGFISSSEDLFEGVLMPSENGSNELVFKLIRKDAGSLGAPDLNTNSGGDANYDFIGERRYLLLITKEGYNSSEVVHSTVGNTGETLISVALEKTVCSNLSGVIKDQSTGKGIPGAVVKIESTCDKAEQVFITNKMGQFDICLPLNCDFIITGIKENYQNNSLSINNLDDIAPFSKEILLTPAKTTLLTEGAVIVLNNIYYDFNKSYIREGAAAELDGLLAVLQKYPSMKIELSSHTDSRGRSSYNQRLSRKRAESAKEYLVARGIDPSRIVAVGFGESQLRNGCSDSVRCTEEEHQYNRRTEVKILKIDNPVNIKYDDKGPEVIDRKN